LPVAVVLTVAAVVLVLFRLHAFAVPLETDEGNYAYIGERLLRGGSLYVDVWDHQPFGVFALFAGAIAMLGDEPWVFRLLALVFSLGSLGLVFALTWRVTGARAAAAGAALLFALASADPGTAGEGCNREIYMNTLILAAWVLALAPRGRWAWNLIAAGVLLGVASTLKTIVAAHWACLAVYVLGFAATPPRPRREGSGEGVTAAASPLPLTSPSIGGGGLSGILPPSARVAGRIREAAAALLAFSVGPALIWAGTFAYYALTGRFGLFFDAVFLCNLSYSAGQSGLLGRFAQFFNTPRHPFIFASAMALWVGGLGGVGVLLLSALLRKRQEAWGLILLVVANYLAICLPVHFWPHYYYLMIPALAVAVGAGLQHAADLIEHHCPRLPGGPALVAFGGGGFFLLWLLATQYAHYLAQPPFGITAPRYNSRDFWGRAHGLNVAQVTEPQDEVFVYGNEAQIYYYAGRRCASRFTMITGLSAGYRGAEHRRAILMEELRARPPRLILVLFDQPPFEEWTTFLHEQYDEPIGWDFHDLTGELIMFVLARRDAPVPNIDWNWDRSEVGGWFLERRRRPAP